MNDLIKSSYTCRILVDVKFTTKELYILFFYIFEDSFLVELDILFDKFFVFDFY